MLELLELLGGLDLEALNSASKSFIVAFKVSSLGDKSAILAVLLATASKLDLMEFIFDGPNCVVAVMKAFGTRWGHPLRTWSAALRPGAALAVGNFMPFAATLDLGVKGVNPPSCSSSYSPPLAGTVPLLAGTVPLLAGIIPLAGTVRAFLTPLRAACAGFMGASSKSPVFNR